MQITSRFAMVVHMLVAIEVFKGKQKTTSDFLATSINMNPVVVRRLLLQLKAAGLIGVSRGSRGASLKKKPSEITLHDVYNAVDCVANGELFHFHETPNITCPVGSNIHSVLDGRLDDIQETMEEGMKNTSLEDLIIDANALIMAEGMA